MKRLIHIVAAILLLGIAAFCLFGFMATYEPIDSAVTVWGLRIGYSVVGIVSFAGALLLVISALRKRD